MWNFNCKSFTFPFLLSLFFFFLLNFDRSHFPIRSNGIIFEVPAHDVLIPMPDMDVGNMVSFSCENHFFFIFLFFPFFPFVFSPPSHFFISPFVRPNGTIFDVPYSHFFTSLFVIHFPIRPNGTIFEVPAHNVLIPMPDMDVGDIVSFSYENHTSSFFSLLFFPPPFVFAFPFIFSLPFLSDPMEQFSKCLHTACLFQ
jgi:hypothetical protein